MKQTELQHGYLKIRSSENLKFFKRQRNFCRRLYKKERKKDFNNLDLYNTLIILSDKGVNTTNISLLDEPKTVTKDKEVVKTLNQYFSTVLNSLHIIK